MGEMGEDPMTPEAKEVEAALDPLFHFFLADREDGPDVPSCVRRNHNDGPPMVGAAVCLICLAWWEKAR